MIFSRMTEVCSDLIQGSSKRMKNQEKPLPKVLISMPFLFKLILILFSALHLIKLSKVAKTQTVSKLKSFFHLNSARSWQIRSVALVKHQKITSEFPPFWLRPSAVLVMLQAYICLISGEIL